MMDTGIVRKLDELGRIVIPMELRKRLGLKNREPLAIYVDNDKIILSLYKPLDIFTGEANENEKVITFNGYNISESSIHKLNQLLELSEKNKL